MAFFGPSKFFGGFWGMCKKGLGGSMRVKSVNYGLVWGVKGERG